MIGQRVKVVFTRFGKAPAPCLSRALLLLLIAAAAGGWKAASAADFCVANDNEFALAAITAQFAPTTIELVQGTYHVDGTVFDASQQPTPFIMDGVYPGFAEAMSRMQEGGEYRFSMPQKLTGGATMPPTFPKDSKLTFDVRVRKIARGGAAMMQQMQAQQMQQALEQQQQQAQPPQP